MTKLELESTDLLSLFKLKLGCQTERSPDKRHKSFVGANFCSLSSAQTGSV